MRWAGVCVVLVMVDGNEGGLGFGSAASDRGAATTASVCHSASHDSACLPDCLTRTLIAAPCSYITDVDFDVGGPLHHVQMELLLWASYRGQLLARTVRCVGEGAGVGGGALR